MFTIDLTTLNVPDVEEWQAQLAIATASALPAAAEVLREAADSCFERQADPWGNAWAPHADSTLEGRARAAAGPTRVRRNFIGPLRRGERSTRDRRWTRRRSERASAAVFGAKILILHGILRMSLHGEVLAGPNGSGIARVTAGGPAAAYAGVHQWGSKDGKTPARPYLALRGNPEDPTVDLPEAVHAEVVATIQDAIDQFVARMNAQRASAAAAGGT
jgi:phage gpG-like protein